MRSVYQLHCQAWPDMEAPRDTKVLLDLYEEAEDVLSKNPGSTMMVHCSAGVGRTGTFIGLFKLAKDFENDQVTSRQRCVNCQALPKLNLQLKQEILYDVTCF